jgi:hypothetical protein
MNRPATPRPKTASPGLEIDRLSPTSALPFAARHCDLPYLDYCEGGSRLAIDAMRKRGAGELAHEFVELCNERTLQLSAWVDTLQTIEDHLKWAYRGGSPDGLPALACFSRACAMLGLATGSLELIVIDSGASLDDFCNSLQTESDLN